MTPDNDPPAVARIKQSIRANLRPTLEFNIGETAYARAAIHRDAARETQTYEEIRGGAEHHYRHPRIIGDRQTSLTSHRA